MTPAENLTAALRGRWHGSYGLACCPAHEDRTPSLSLQDGTERVLLRCHGGCSREAVIAELKRRNLWGGESGNTVPSLERREIARTSDNGKRDVALKLWRGSLPIADTPAERYLRARGLTLELPPTLRFAPSLKHGPTGLYFPALVACVQAPDRSVTAVHRIFLVPDGRKKAEVSDAKMALGPLGCGAIRLAPAGETLGIAEGIETALAAAQLHGLPVWSAVSAGRMRTLWLPPEVRHVVIFGDRDRAGEENAREAAKAFAERGLRVSGRFPDAGDWNDELLRQRSEAA